MNAEFYFNRGLDKIRIKNLTGAIEDFTIAIQLSSRTTKKTITTDVGEGVTHHVNVVDISVGHLNMYYNRACAFVDIGNYEDAIYDFSKVIQYNPEDAEAYFKRAIAYCCIGNVEQKNEDLAKAYKLDPKYNQELFSSMF